MHGIDVGSGCPIADTVRLSCRLSFGLHAVEDEPDAGDLYTFCPDGPTRAGDFVGSRVIRDDDVALELFIETALPRIRLQTVVRLMRGSDVVEMQTTVENEAENHRLRVLFPIETDASVVRAE